MSRLFSIEPVGILKACTTNVRMNNARITAMMTDSKYSRAVDFLNVVFAATSLFLFLSVVWMVWDDYDRDWKNTQRRFAQLEYQVTQQQLQAAGQSVDKTKQQQLEAQLKAAQANVAANRKKVDELQAKLEDANERLYRATVDQQTMKATYEEDRYDFEATRAANPASSSVAKKQQIANDEAQKLNELTIQLDRVTADTIEVLHIHHSARQPWDEK